jgi:hypothetical protein
MRLKLTMLLGVPQSLPSAADLLFYSPLPGTIPATSSGQWIVVGWSWTFGSTASITSITSNPGSTYFEAGHARSVNSSRDMGGTSYAYSNAGAATRTEEVDPVVIESVFSLVLERH